MATNMQWLELIEFMESKKEEIENKKNMLIILRDEYNQKILAYLKEVNHIKGLIHQCNQQMIEENK